LALVDELLVEGVGGRLQFRSRQICEQSEGCEGVDEIVGAQWGLQGRAVDLMLVTEGSAEQALSQVDPIVVECLLDG
jgi:hypothetical protein